MRRANMTSFDWITKCARRARACLAASAVALLLCALPDGAKAQNLIYSWGNNVFGQLSDQNNIGTTAANPNATLIVLLLNSRYVSAGADFGAALLSNGQVWTWGHNNVGQLGYQPATQYPNPVPAQVIGVPPIAAISA